MKYKPASERNWNLVPGILSYQLTPDTSLCEIKKETAAGWSIFTVFNKLSQLCKLYIVEWDDDNALWMGKDLEGWDGEFCPLILALARKLFGKPRNLFCRYHTVMRVHTIKISKTQPSSSVTLIYYFTSLHISAYFSAIIGSKIFTQNLIAIQCIMWARIYRFLVLLYKTKNL